MADIPISKMVVPGSNDVLVLKDSSAANKVSSPTFGNLAGLDANGNLTDAGWASDKTTTHVSGNPISISGLKTNQLAVNPIITLEPIQAGSGNPSPSNVRAISGYDKIEVLSCGKNLCDNNKVVKGYYGDNGIWIQDNDFASSDFIAVKPNTSYSATLFDNSGNSIDTLVVTFWSASKGFQRQVTTSPFQTDSDTKYVVIRTYQSDSDYVTTNNFKFQLELGSSATTYEPYHKTTDLSLQIGQTVYGGTLDVETGVLTVDRVLVTKNTSTMNNNPNYPGWIDSGIKDLVGIGYDAGVSDAIMNVGTVYSYNTMSGNDVLFLPMSTYNKTQDEWKQLAIDIQIIVDLATPYTIQLTPHEISLLKDYAYVSTNGTNMQFSYKNGEMASLGDVAQLGETLNALGDVTSPKGYYLAGSIPLDENFTIMHDGILIITANPNSAVTYWDAKMLTGFSISGTTYYDNTVTIPVFKGMIVKVVQAVGTGSAVVYAFDY